MKPFVPSTGLSAHSQMTRCWGIASFLCLPIALLAQGDKELRAQADALFAQGEYGAAFQPYQTLVGNNQQDFDLNFRFGVCAMHGGGDRDEAIKYLKRSTMGPAPNPLAWYFLGKAHHLSYQFKEALVAYERYRGTADKKMLAERPVDALELQCRNGQNLLSNLKEIDVHNKVEVAGNDFFRFYDLSSIGGKIVVTPDELKSSADKKAKDLALVYLPDKGGPIYFASYGKGNGTGRDIYRSELMPNGEFAAPVKLAGYINTAEDEDFPFMAPDGKSFYFCSKGHNSMGGYDVFKSTYDKGMDVFGAPVNMDFAVNTPDDDLLYLTDPEGKEACFASGRDSKQGTVHVYRVSTAQAPVNITVLKGTFASQFNADDRKAHITVQDALTQENVADVATDMNGNYVLSLPRSGKYRFMVSAGPTGKTHVGVVDVPRNDEPRAYRQEMSLVDQGGEKLMIRNYFDQPLEEDMIALALDEIKRRARLDVGTHAAVAEEPPVEQPKGDPITRAGFAGDVSRTSAQKMADEDAAALTKATEDLEHQSVAAFSIALENANLAESHTKRAEELVAQAGSEVDETRKNELMMQAARERQSARAAGQRAIAALRAGEDLAEERKTTQVRAQKATKLSGDLTRVMAGSDDNAMVIKLVELRTRMDEKNAPDGNITPAEKMRRMATEREKEATATLARANTARGEENELVDRIARKKREEDDAKGNKKENIARERAELESQLQAMREENERAFAKARMAERETGNARGQAALAKHLATAAAGMTVNELNEEQQAELAQRITAMDPRIAAIAIDERYDAAIAMEAHELQRRTFDWGEPLDAGTSQPVASTRTLQRDSTSDARHADRTTTMVSNGDLPQGQVRQGGTVDHPEPLVAEASSNGSPEGTAPAVSTDPSTTLNGQTTDGDRSVNGSVEAGDQTASAPATGHADRNETAGDVARSTEGSGVTGQEDTATGAEKGGSAPGGEHRAGSEGSTTPTSSERLADAGQAPSSGDPRTTAPSTTTGTDAEPATRVSEPVGISRTDTDLASMKGAVTTLVEHDTDSLATSDQPSSRVEEGAVEEDRTEPENAEELAFLQANQLAELRQLRAAERSRARKDSLDARIADLERSMREGTAGTQETADASGANDSGQMNAPQTSTGTESGVSGTERPMSAENGRSGTDVPPNTVTQDNADEATVGTDPIGRDAATSGQSGQGEHPANSTDQQGRSGVDVSRDEPGTTSGIADAATSGTTGSSEKALEFGDGVNDTQLVADLYPDYATSKLRIERDADEPKERSAALHGLELMLVDSIEAENTRQLEHLERHPEESATVLKRVDRLRRMKEEHVQAAERALEASDQQYAAGESRAMEDAALSQKTTARQDAGAPIAASITPHNDDYVNIAEDREQVYTSTMDHRTTKAAEAIRERDRDMATLVGLEESIDSLEAVLEGMPSGREQTKLRDKTDRLIDDHMILRTEIGQRMGFITKKEFEAAQDSSKRLASLNDARGLPPNEPQLLLARSLEESALSDMNKAKRMRQQAERTEDIVLRDSLFRTAYGQELTALRAMDRAHTVRNHVQSEGYSRGEQLSYEEVERRMFHADEQLADTRDASAEQPQVVSGDGAVPSGTATEQGAEDRTNGTSGKADVTSHGDGTGIPDGTVAAQPLGDRYKEFMGTDNASSLTGAPEADASSLRFGAQRAAERSRELEQASILAADRANAFQDSATTAKRSERERLEHEATRARAASDSLHAASLLAADASAELDRKAGDAQQAAVFQERLLKYYYLNDQEQALVVNEEDRSRYFQARSKALAQREEAVLDQEQAASSKQLGDTLLQQSKLILEGPNAGGPPLTTEQMEQARLLADRALVLHHRADSLQRASERMNMAASVNESQAASMLQALTPERGTEIMAMEQRSRRVEPLLAQARSLQGADGAADTGVPSTGSVAPSAASTPDIAGVTIVPSVGQNTSTGTTDRAAATNINPPAGDGTTSTRTEVETPATSPAALTPPATDAVTAATPTATPTTPEPGAPRLLAPLTEDVFAVGAEATPRSGAIPLDQPMPAGVVYKVQIGAFKQDIPQELFSDLTPVSGESVSNGLTRYSVGMFTNAESAVKATQTVRQRGYRDAFVVAYQDGRRVSLTQAMRAARPVTASAAATAELPSSAPVRISPPPATVAVTPSDSAIAAEQAVLANYPATAEQVLAQFQPPADATAYYNVPGAAPARQVETVKGLFFTVQVGVYSKPTALDKLFNITPLNSERTENAKIRYTTGVFTDMEKARSRKDQTVTLGVKDAFITAYLNGKRIPMRDARALINKFGQSVFADPALITR